MEQKYYFKQGSKWKGPYSHESIIEMGLPEDSLIWQEGLNEGTRLDTLFRNKPELSLKEEDSNSLHAALKTTRAEETLNSDSDFGYYPKRFSAWLIDSLILFFVYSFTALVGIIHVPDEAVMGSFGGIYFFTSPLFLLTSGAYFALFESSKWQATPGKILMQIKVCSEDDKQIRFFNGIGRYIAKVISGYTLLLGFLVMFFTLKRQGFHDQLAKTLVMTSGSERARKKLSIFILLGSFCAYLSGSLIGVITSI